MNKSRLLISAFSAIAIGIVGLAPNAPAAGSPGTTLAAVTAANDVVGADPAAGTPWINNKQPSAMLQVDNTMIIGGPFTGVSSGTGTAVDRKFIFAFDVTTNQISTSFKPAVSGSVNAIVPGPTPGTVFIGGAFTQVNGVAASHVALLNLSDGSLVTSFKPKTINGTVQTMALRNGRLFIGGYFKKVAGVNHNGLATLNPNTGALDPYMNIQLAEHHNNTGSGQVGSVGAVSMDINAQADRLIVIGNFRTANGALHDQILMVNISGSSAQIQPDWNTTRYQPLCFSFAFDSYVRRVQFAPNGDWFAVAATGGPGQGTLCDAAARFETYAQGSNVQETWFNASGGDTLYGLTVTDKVVYVGGHQRWMNNSFGGDNAAQGAVPRPGLVALDAVNGVPLKWNPGRNPRGAGAYTLYMSPTGLWVGSDTSFIGPPNRKFKRPRLAFFPNSTGYNLPTTEGPALPSDVYLGGDTNGSNSNILYRVDAGGPELQALDSGPDWSADESFDNPLRNSGSNVAGYGPVPAVDNTVPASTPNAIFDIERWDPGDGDEMQWHFPVPNGQQLDVRLYFANRYDGTTEPDSRVFDVSIDSTKVLDNFDIIKATGHARGTMRHFAVTSDGTVDITFGHEVENPLINGIEIVRTDIAPPPPNGDTFRSVNFDGSNAGASTTRPGGGIAWGTTRGAFMLGSTLYYGQNDGFLYSRSFDGHAFGAVKQINPYVDPVWDNVSNGSGGVYRGSTVGFYSQIPNVRGMFYSGGRIYYTLSGKSDLFYRYFTPDSGLIGPDEFTASGGLSWSDAGGMFVNGSTLYFVKRSTGALWSVPFADGAPSGSATEVSSPATGGPNWNAKAAFIGPSAN